ncbi:MAG: bifunctional oligoribonuclease/PAP phosphatase NrnA [Flavobacteriaceae bacterium]|nr:bifunctional oligoribonuclease/PAP phosphatase NrnA [Flavobacteriaceae bacterium]
MEKNDVESVKKLISTPKNIIIVAHKNPDGDAIGSSLGLYHYLNIMGHKATVIVPNDYPEFLKWMPGTETIVNYEASKDTSDILINSADIIFTLDFNLLSRSGSMASALENSEAIKIMIDHHQQPDTYAKYTYSDTAMSSTSEMIYHFINKMGDISLVTKEMATCLYAGIVTDTGSFRFASTTAQTHEVVADLIKKGAKNDYIHNSIFDNNSYHRMQLLGCALNNMKVLPELKTAYITLSQAELNKYNFVKGDTEGFVNYGLSVKGIVFAAIFIENLQENIVKISFRSKGDFSVNEFARKYFNGGGHNNAAGGRSDLPLKETTEKFESLLPKYKDELNK